MKSPMNNEAHAGNNMHETITTPYEKMSDKEQGAVYIDMSHSDFTGGNSSSPDKENYQDNYGLNDSIMTPSSVITMDKIADVQSFRINSLVVLISDMARGIFFPTMWELVQTVGGDQVTLGYAVASFSFGRMLVLPLFGSWSIKYGYKFTLLFTAYILLLGCILFGFILTVRKPEYLIFANIILGIGSGTLGVTLAYVSDVTPCRKRIKYMAGVTAIQYAGTTATPLIGSLFIILFPSDEMNRRGLPQINEFTVPALFMAACTVLTIYLLHFYFEDRPRTVNVQQTRKTSRQRTYEEISESRACCGLFSLYHVCLYGCMALNTFTKGPMACFETLGIDFAESQFGLHRANAGFIVAVMGTFGSLLLLLIAKVSDYLNIDDAQLTNGGISIFIMGVVMNTFLDKENVENNQTWRYVFSIFLCYGIGYPICHTALISLFSKIVGRRPQGTLQGWFSASGSIGRVSFPIMSGYVVSNFDIETLFYILSVVLGCSVFFLLHFRSVFSRLSSS